MAQRPPDPEDERRFLVRYPSTHSASILLDSDAMRIGMEVRIVNLSVSGLALQAAQAIAEGEFISVTVENAVQRFKKTVRGRVRHCTASDGDRWLIGVELMTRFSPLEISLLRMRASDEDDQKPKWM